MTLTIIITACVRSAKYTDAKQWCSRMKYNRMKTATHYPLASAVLPLQTLSVSSLKLTASSRPTASPSGSAKCLRFDHWLTLCTLSMHILTYLLNAEIRIARWKVLSLQPQLQHGSQNCYNTSVRWKKIWNIKKFFTQQTLIIIITDCKLSY